MKRLVWLCLLITFGSLAQPVELRPGESAVIGEEGTRVGFEGVVRDSRCPKGEQCLVAGDAVVRIWVRRGQGPKVEHELQTGKPNNAGVRVLRLEPVPVSGRPVAAGDYRLTLAPRDPGTEPADR